MSARSVRALAVLTTVIVLAVPGAPGMGSRGGVAGGGGIAPLSEAPAWTDSLDDMSHVYVPPGGLVGVEVAGGEARLQAGSTEGWIASSVISCPADHRYDLIFVEVETPGASSFRVSVLNASKEPTEVGYANETIPGFAKQHSTRDVSVITIPPSTYARLRIQVNLLSSGSDRPRLLAWSLYYIGLEEWRDDFLGTGKMSDFRNINLTDGRVEVNLTRRGGGGGAGGHEAYPAMAVAGSWTALSLYYPNAGRTGYQDVANLGDGSTGVDIADIDADGYLDLAVSGGNSVTIYWGDSSETWTATSSTTTLSAGSAQRVEAGDMNGDGYLDIAIGGYSTSGSADSVAYLNAGGRTFSGTPDLRLSGSEYTSCQVGDVDNDGYEDIVFGMGAWGHTDEVRVFYGGASGPSSANSLVLFTDRCYDLMLKDIDGDGFLDLMVAGNPSGKMPVYMGSEDGIDATADYSLTTSGTYVLTVAAGDVNGDGFMDIVTAEGDTNSYRYYFYEGDEDGWSDSRKHSSGYTNNYVGYATDCMDLDLDGYDDVLLTTWEGSSYVVKAMMGGTAWPTSVAWTKTGAGGGELAFAVFEGGGGRYYKGSFTTQSITIDPAVKKWDVLVLDGSLPLNTTLSVSVLDNSAPRPQPIAGYEDLQAWDVDLSGLGATYPIIHVQVEVASEFNWTTPVLERMFVKWMDKGAWREEFYGTAKVERLVNTGVDGGLLGTDVRWWDGHGSNQVLFTSLRGDAGYDSRPVIHDYYKGFYERGDLVYLNVIGTSSVDSSDVNDDDLTDLVFAVYQTSDSTFDAKSPLFLGHPAGFKAKPSHEFPTVGAMEVLLRDLNRDGFADVVFAQEQDGTTFAVNSTLFWGNANGWNTTPDAEFSTRGASDVETADFDGDGRLDLAFACYKDASTSTDSMVFLQGAAGFDGAMPTFRLPTMGARGVASGDLDGDGRVDIVFANSFGGGSAQIDSYVYWGRAGGGFEPTPGRLPTVGAEDVAIGTFNSSGSGPDIAFANYKDNSNNRHTDSYIYDCDRTRTLPTTPGVRIPTVGAVDVEVAGFDDVGPEDLVFACRDNGTSYQVESYVRDASNPPWIRSWVSTVGATDSISGGIMPTNKAAYMSKAIAPEDWKKAGGFHTLRYTATLGTDVKGKVQLIDAGSWDVLAETELESGSNEWVVDGLFSMKEHPSVRILVTAARVYMDDFTLDGLWLNWTVRTKAPPRVHGIEAAPSAILRLSSGSLALNVTDEYDPPKDLVVSVETRLNGTMTWSSTLFSGAPAFSAGAWRVTVFPRADAQVGSHDVRVQVMDVDLMYSGYVEFPNALTVLNNLPSAPEVRIIPDNPITTLTLQASITTPARDAESGALSYRYRWSVDGTLVDTITTDTVPAALTERGQNWSVEVRAFDGMDESAPAVAWTVILNAPPQTRTPIPSPEILEDTVDDQWIDLSKAFEDPDGDVMTFGVDPTPEHIQVTIDPATGKVTLRPAENWYGQESITFHASDGAFSTSQTALVTVTAVNDRPRYTTVNGQPITTDPVALSVDQGQLLFITIGATDVEGDELVFSVNTTAVEVDEATGTITFQPGNDDVGTLRFALTMYDVATPSAKVTLNFTLTVVNRNDPMEAPRIVNPPTGSKFKVGTTFSLIGVCNDPDAQYGQRLTFTWRWNGTNLIGEGTSLTWNFTAPGTYNITLTVSDGEFEKVTSVEVIIEPKDIPTPPLPPDGDGDDGGGIGTATLIGILVVLIIIGGAVFVVVSKRHEEAKEATEVEQEKRDAIKQMALAVKATADQMELETGKAAVVPKAGGVRTGELEEVTIEQRGPGGGTAVLTSKGLEEGMLSMKPKETEAASKDTELLFKDVARAEVTVSAEDQERMRLDNLKRRYSTAIGRMPYGIPAPDLKAMDWNDLAALLATGQKRTLPDGHEVTLVKGKWYYSDPSDSSTFLKEHGAKPKVEPRRAAAAAPAPPMDRAALLAKLEERFILGEISEDAYKELKRKYDSEGKRAKPGGSDWVEDE